MELLQVLEKTVSTDQSELEAAQRFLEQAAVSDLPLLLKKLSEILKQEEYSLVARMQAGLQLKNLIYSKDPNVRLQHQQRWLQLDEKDRLYIKQNCVATLGTETMRPSQAAQVISGIACAELPMQLWPDLITMLTQNVINNSSTEMMREATLETIGYICTDIDPMILTNEANNILTAIVFGMKKEEPSDHVRLAATNALLNSLEFTRGNFEKDCERHFIMQVTCEATQSLNTHIKVAALQCLVKIMSLYYQYMETYMGPALFAISMEAMKSEVDEVALQGIEFWSNVCDEEVDLAIEASEAAEQGRPPERVSKFYAKGALQFLIPLLTVTLAKQEESDDDDEWNPCKAAGVCLMLLATCCENAVVPQVMEFIRENIHDADWRKRDASVMALGCILEGPDQSVFAEFMGEVVPDVVNLLQDPSIVVRDTSAWTIGRMCEVLPEYIINEQFLMPLLDGLLKGLQSAPRVAANVCWAFSSLAEAAYEAAEVGDEDSEPNTYCLTPVYENIVEQLLATTDRPDSNQQNLRSAAYEAIMELVKNSPKDCYESVQKTTMIILQRLENVLNMEAQMAQMASSSDRAVYNDLQSLLCATLQSVLRKVTPEDAPKISDAIMSAILRMFSNTSGPSGGVQEDALLAVSTLVEVLGDGFMKYLDAFKPFLMIGLSNTNEYQVCVAAVGLVGDICRAVSIKILPICEEILGVLLNILQDTKVHRSVKPQILSVFGDIALAIGPEFSKCMDVVLNTLYQASKAQVDLSDPDMVDYLNDLREACLEAYTGIIQGLKGTGQAPTQEVMAVAPHVPHMIEFIEEIAGDNLKNDGCVSSCCGLIGDLCTTFGAVPGVNRPLQAFDGDKIQGLLTMGRRSKVPKTKTLATWASKEWRKLKSAQS